MSATPRHNGYPVASPEVFHSIELFTEGKNPPTNEDLTGWNETTLVLSDGATDKTGLSFEGRTGGELAAQLVVEACLASSLSGEALVDEATASLQALYARINREALHDSRYRFAATMVAVKGIGDAIIVTQVGDSSFRINGTYVYSNDKAVDTLTTGARKAYIETTGDIAGSRDFILPLLKEQHHYQNNADSPLGYGVVDGAPVPVKFVRTYAFPRDDVHTIELVSDGYYGMFPNTPTVEAYEDVHQYIERTDPYKCGQFASTKLSDDRTVVIATLR